MRFQIHHLTRYTYSQAVFLEPHVVRLRPRSNAAQQLRQYRLEVTPKPAGISEGLDAEGNDFVQLWFDGLHDHLDIAVTSEADTFRTNPYAGLLGEGADHLPLWPLVRDESSLQAYLESGAGLGLSPAKESDQTAVHELADTVLHESQGRTLDFLLGLSTQLYRSIEQIARKDPGIQPTSETLTTKKGACRDLATVFMAACRHVGIPARFVSGYQEGDPDKPYRELHAWVEVFLPGPGWRGYDPTNGLAVADRHIVLASSAIPQNAAPVTGAFRGTDADSKLEHLISIRTQ